MSRRGPPVDTRTPPRLSNPRGRDSAPGRTYEIASSCIISVLGPIYYRLGAPLFFHCGFDRNWRDATRLYELSFHTRFLSCRATPPSYFLSSSCLRTAPRQVHRDLLYLHGCAIVARNSRSIRHISYPLFVPSTTSILIIIIVDCSWTASKFIYDMLTIHLVQ
jgi:hypothetical protein